MKINRFVAFALIALLVVGAMAAISFKVFAQGGVLHSARTFLQAQDCAQEAADGAEAQSANDTDHVEQQCGDQNAPDGQGSQGKEIQGKEDTGAAPGGTPAITVEQAQTAALAAHSGTVLKVELNEENGKLVYGVEFQGGADVKVDAMTGQVIDTETGQD